jgi:hypothetical protein
LAKSIPSITTETLLPGDALEFKAAGDGAVASAEEETDEASSEAADSNDPGCEKQSGEEEEEEENPADNKGARGEFGDDEPLNGEEAADIENARGRSIDAADRLRAGPGAVGTAAAAPG